MFDLQLIVHSTDHRKMLPCSVLIIAAHPIVNPFYPPIKQEHRISSRLSTLPTDILNRILYHDQ